MRNLFVAYRDAPERRRALKTPGALDRYRLFGLDEFARRGVQVRHNLERESVPLWSRAAGRAANRTVDLLGGIGGDFAGVLPSVRVLNGADVVFSTVDTVGIPLLTLKRARLLRPPLVYVSIGLPERLRLVRDERRFRETVQGARTIVTYSEVEAERLRAWIGRSSPRIVFVPFGVDVSAFRPTERQGRIDVLSVGADPRRDFDLLLGVARRRADLRFHLVVGTDNRRLLRDVPPNVGIEADVPLETVRERLAEARLVVLPVRDNTYSGATTTLLQAMAMAKPVVVSRTEAIARGYGLEDGVNCRLVTPGDGDAFERAVSETLTGADAGRSLGIRARETVERDLSWERYTSALWDVLAAAI